jgi:hypothetical protein
MHTSCRKRCALANSRVCVPLSAALVASHLTPASVWNWSGCQKGSVVGGEGGVHGACCIQLLCTLTQCGGVPRIASTPAAESAAHWPVAAFVRHLLPAEPWLYQHEHSKYPIASAFVLAWLPEGFWAWG